MAGLEDPPALFSLHLWCVLTPGGAALWLEPGSLTLCAEPAG